MKKLFDRMHYQSLWKILSAYGCSDILIRIVKALYNNFTCSVIDDNKWSNRFSITIGVREGCIMSPLLFLMAIYWDMRKSFCNKRREILVTITSILEGLEFADTIVLVLSNSKHLQRTNKDISKYAEQIGLNIWSIKLRQNNVASSITCCNNCEP